MMIGAMFWRRAQTTVLYCTYLSRTAGSSLARLHDPDTGPLPCLHLPIKSTFSELLTVLLFHDMMHTIFGIIIHITLHPLIEKRPTTVKAISSMSEMFLMIGNNYNL